MAENDDVHASGVDDGDRNKTLGPEEFLIFGDMRYAFIEPTNAELALIRIRVIALENLLISLLAEGSDRQRQAAREMASFVSPRPGFSHHPLTSQAADHMSELVDRAERFCTKPPA